MLQMNTGRILSQPVPSDRAHYGWDGGSESARLRRHARSDGGPISGRQELDKRYMPASYQGVILRSMASDSPIWQRPEGSRSDAAADA